VPLLFHEAKRYLEESADPEFFIGVGAVEHCPRLKAQSNPVPGRAVVETSFNRILIFPDAARIENIVRRAVESNASAVDAAEVPIAGVKFPIFNLLEQTERDDIQVVRRRVIPAEESVRVATQAGPAEMFSREQLRLDSRRASAGRERNVLIVTTGQNRTGTECQSRYPRAGRFVLFENLVAQAKRHVHQAGCGSNGAGRSAVSKITPPDRRITEAEVGSPFCAQPILQAEITLVDVDAVVLAIGHSIHQVPFVSGPEMVGLGFIVGEARHHLAVTRHVGPLRERLVGEVFAGLRARGGCDQGENESDSARSRLDKFHLI
jgi:hypothetical protein